MKSLKENVEEFKFQLGPTIKSLGWGSHIDSSRGGLVIEVVGHRAIVAHMNEEETGFVLAYGYDDLSDQQKSDVDEILENLKID